MLHLHHNITVGIPQSHDQTDSAQNGRSRGERPQEIRWEKCEDDIQQNSTSLLEVGMPTNSMALPDDSSSKLASS